MDPTRFDTLTKALATGTSRRQALKTIAATTLAGLLGLGGIGTAFAKCHNAGHACGTYRDCCSLVCCNHVCCDNVCCNGVCCPPGQSCYNGTCVTENLIYCDCNDGSLRAICNPTPCPDVGPLCQQVCANYGGSWGWGCAGTC
jgi:hypothetical protein